MANASWVPLAEDKPAPMPLLLVQSFLNTLDLEQGTDALSHAETALPWLTAAGLISSAAQVGPQELATMRAVREGLRALVRSSGGGADLNADELRALQSVADARHPVVGIDPTGRVSLTVGDDAEPLRALLRLLLVVRDAQADGTWARLKLCANPDCLWAFYDRSRNRQGTWCTMAVCGNRLKNRRFRAREH